MPNRERPSAEQAPELHNSEQDDELEQSQTVADEALAGGAREASPLDSIKKGGGESPEDLIDKMRDMEQSGRIDMGAYSGEPNMDDNEDMYGDENREDDLRSDGT
jgi:hypothetical protein